MANLLERRNMMTPLSDNWLSKYALQVIVTAFGYPKCTAIIQATNDYLDNIADGDFNKAYMLAGVINEDPMLVCSLELQLPGVAMPIRKLVINGGGIMTDIVPTLDTSIDLEFEISSITNPAYLKLSYNSNNSAVWSYEGSLDGRIQQVQLSGMSFPLSTNTKYDLKYNRYKVQFFAESQLVRNIAINVTNLTDIDSIKFFHPFNDERTFRGKTKGALVIRGSEGHRIVPCYHDISYGLLDLYSLSFFANSEQSGSFTIEYTLPDGTPWTPGT